MFNNRDDNDILFYLSLIVFLLLSLSWTLLEGCGGGRAPWPSPEMRPDAGIPADTIVEPEVEW